MNRTDTALRVLFFLAGIPFLYFVFTQRDPNWIYYTSLALIFIGLIYNLLSDWNKGKKAQVKKRLIMYAVFIGIMLLFVALKR
jgi:membrane protein insertase Oxa1/YidC/SpoIIIJ